MILYFSATGNSQYVAQKIASKTNDTILSITECIEKDAFQFEIQQGERLGIISPTYAWGLPSIVLEFLERFHVNSGKNPYVYFVATYGTTSGQAGRFAKEKLQNQNVDINAYFSVKMPDTWTLAYDLSNPLKVRKINGEAEKEIDSVIDKV